MSANPSHFANHMSAPHHHPAMPSRSLRGIPYVRKHFFAPEVLPLVGVLTLAIGMGVYFGSGAARKNDVHWHHRHQPWLHNATDNAHWDGVDGVREMLMAAGKHEYVRAGDEIKHARH